MSTWKRTSTADLISSGVLEIGDGYRAKNAEFETEGGLPFIRVGDIQHQIDLTVSDQLPIRLAKTYGRKVSQPHDSLITMKGTVGRVAYVTPMLPSFVYSPQISYWRSHSHEVLHPRWLRYWLESPEFGQQASATKGATDMADYINLRDQRRMTITLPPLPIQERVAGVLGTLEDLIENNRRRVEVLEEMARVIYREWFVNFRYPGHEDAPLVDSALGPIPDGWALRDLDQLVQVSKTSVDPSTMDPDTPAVGLEHIPRNQLTLDSWGSAAHQGSRKTVFTKGDILFGKIRPYFHKVCVAPVDGISSTDAIVIRPESRHWGQVVMLVSSDEFVAHATQTSNGTKMPRADWKVLSRWPVAVPPAELSEQLTGLVRDKLQLAETLNFENRQLAEIRDRLLPRLVTGQIDISKPNLEASATSVKAGESAMA